MGVMTLLWLIRGNLEPYARSLFTGNFWLQKGAEQVNLTAGTILDTGAPTTHLFLPGGIEIPQDFHQGNRAATGISFGMTVQSSAQSPPPRLFRRESSGRGLHFDEPH